VWPTGSAASRRGKRANLVVTDGDILEIATRVKQVFIGGQPMNLTTRFDEAQSVYGSAQIESPDLALDMI
jgi:hypothetical protein